MKKQILGFALLFALSTSLHAQTTDTSNKVITPESKTGSNSTYGNNGSNNTLDTSGVKSDMNNNATPMTPGGTKTDSTGSKRKPPKGHMNKQKNNMPQNGGSNPQ